MLLMLNVIILSPCCKTRNLSFLKMVCVGLSSFHLMSNLLFLGWWSIKQKPLEMIEVKQIQHSSEIRAGYARPYI